MSARKAKCRALLRMQRKPIPYGKFIPCRRYVPGQLFNDETGIGAWEEFRFIVSPAMDVMRE